MGNEKGPSEADGFIACHGLWDAQQHSLVQDCLDRIQHEQITLIRLIWCDTHGITRAKAVTPQAFKSVLVNGYSIGAGSWSLDASGGRVFQTFTAGGGMGLSEMTGSPNLILVPDLTSFRLATWFVMITSAMDGRFISPPATSCARRWHHWLIAGLRL